MGRMSGIIFNCEAEIRRVNGLWSPLPESSSPAAGYGHTVPSLVNVQRPSSAVPFLRLLPARLQLVALESPPAAG
jgi:hypothetical protein